MRLKMIHFYIMQVFYQSLLLDDFGQTFDFVEIVKRTGGKFGDITKQK